MINKIAKRITRIKTSHNIDYVECSKCPQCKVNGNTLYCNYIDDYVHDDNYDCPARGRLDFIANRFADAIQEKVKHKIQCIEFAKDSEYIVKTRVQVWNIPKVFDLNIHITNYNKSGYVKNFDTVVHETIELLNKREKEILNDYCEEITKELKDGVRV